MSGDRRGGGRPPGDGDSPPMAARGRGGSLLKKPGQAAGRGQWAPVTVSSSSNASPTIAHQAWNGNGGSSYPPGKNWAVPSDRRPADNPRPPSQTISREPERQAVPNPVVTPPPHQHQNKLADLRKSTIKIIDPHTNQEMKLGQRASTNVTQQPQQVGVFTQPMVYYPFPQQTSYNQSGGSSCPPGNTWAVPSDRRPAARHNTRPPSQTNSREPERQAVPNRVVTPPLSNGWQWKSRPSGPESKKVDVPSSGFDPEMDNSDVEDSSDDDMSDEYDSDASQKSFKTRKMNKWFKSFFEDINTLTVEQVLEPTRPWHCPACKNGPGAIDWFKGLQSLVTHASTKGSRRVKLHRELAALLEEEMSGRGTTVVPSGEQFGKWTGLRGGTDREIVWPPMVIIMNTLLEKDDNDKWLGMGNQELLDYFNEYDATKARHSYGPGGHRGMSVLIFETSAVGYMEAERLHKHFVNQSTDREAWQTKKARFLPGGKRQLYGFLASKEDMEDFNKHCHEKGRLKYEMRSHNEMVVVPFKQMCEDNQKMNYMKNKVERTDKCKKAVEKSFGTVAQKCRELMEEKRVLISRVGEKHSEYEEEMKSQEKFFYDQIENIQKAMEEKECEFEKLLQEERDEFEKLLQKERAKFEKLLQEERAKARQCDVDSGTTENRGLRKEQVHRFTDCQVKDVEEFKAEKDELIKAHEKKKVELEKELDAALTALTEKHKPDTFQASSS